MKIKPWLLVIIIYTLLLLYLGLWSELAVRIKYNQWDIIGIGHRFRGVTNHNLYSKFYLLGLVLIMAIVFFRKALKILNNIKKIRSKSQNL
jgi:hypothetical protein